MIPLMNRCAEKLIRHLDSVTAAGGGTGEIISKEVITGYTIDVVSDVVEANICANMNLTSV